MNNRFRAESGGSVNGTLTVPGDKSISHRALLLSAIGAGRSRLTGFLDGEDCLATASALRAMGVAVDVRGGGEVHVEGVGMHGLQPSADALDMGNSGTAMRLLSGLLSAQSFASVLRGDESLMQRPMERVAVPLRLMGAHVETSEGCPPVRIEPANQLSPVEYKLPVASAQVKSAILLAGLYADGTTRTICPGVTRDHTERMLAGLGVRIEIDDAQHSVSLHGPASLPAADWDIPGDFSSAAFFIVAGLLAASSELEIRNVGLNPSRTGLLQILLGMGGKIEVRNERLVGGEPVGDIYVQRSELKGIDISGNWVDLAIDEFPVLFVAAAGATGVTRVRGAAELRHKETDRLAVMAALLEELGIEVHEYADGIDVVGGRIRGGRVDSCGDHRVAMAAAVAALGMRGAGVIEIANTAQVATSFPGFVATASAIGMRLSESAA